MEEKRADNRYIESYDRNRKSYDIDSKIDAERARINKLDDLEGDVYSLKKSLDSAIELLGKSIKGGPATNRLIALDDENNSSFSALRNYIRSEKSNSEKKIRELYKEKEIREKEEEKKKEDREKDK